MLAGLTASAIVVMLSVAVVNEALQRSSRRRWLVVAQYAMFELGRNARLVWIGVLDLSGLLQLEDSLKASLEAGGRVVRDTPRFVAVVRELIADDDGRRMLHEDITRCAQRSSEVLGRWAGIMLNADAYAEIVDRHVELASDIAWLDGLLDDSAPLVGLRQPRVRFSAALHQDREVDAQWLADKIVVITQLAEELDRLTFEVALRIVPVEWWETRLGASVNSATAPDASG